MKRVRVADASRRIAQAVVLSAVLMPCARALAYQPPISRRVDLPPKPRLFPKPKLDQFYLSDKRSSKWAHGTCAVDGTSLTYTKKDQKATVPLDMPFFFATGLFCSSDYTVIMTPNRAVVALGADGVLSGKLSFDKPAFMSNSYGIKIHNPAKEGIVSVSFQSNTLTLVTRQKTWSIRVDNPSEWEVY
jgi:hypothetical protein